jgi:hypothetical protein
MENLGKFMIIVLAMIISPIVSGFVILKMWDWFVVPIFEANPLRLVEAIGLMFLVNYLKTKRDKEVDKEKIWEQFATDLVFFILYAGFSLLAGWVVSLFM